MVNSVEKNTAKPTPTPREIASWIHTHQDFVMPPIPSRPVYRSQDKSETPYSERKSFPEKLLALWQETVGTLGELQKIGSVFTDATTLPQTEFQKKWAAEDSKKDGYLAFNLPDGLIDRIQQVVEEYDEQTLAGIDTATPLSTEIRIFTDAAAAREVFNNPDTSKGLLHAAVNKLSGTVFTSGGDRHTQLRREIARSGSPDNTLLALKSQGSDLLFNFVNELTGAQAYSDEVDLVTLVHRVVIALFAEEYFPQLVLSDAEAKDLREQPEQVFMKAAGAGLMTNEVAWQKLLHDWLNHSYAEGAKELNQVLIQALMNYADELEAADSFADKPAFIDLLAIRAFENKEFSLMITNLVSAVAAGTDTLTQVIVEMQLAVAEDTEVATETREAIVAEVRSKYPQIARKLEMGNYGFTDDEWVILTSPEKISSKLAELLQEVANQSTPVAWTFKEILEDGKKITCLMPMRQLAGQDGMTAFGSPGSKSLCTGMNQALKTAAVITLITCFTSFRFQEKARPKKKVGIVSTYREAKYKVR